MCARRSPHFQAPPPAILIELQTQGLRLPHTGRILVMSQQSFLSLPQRETRSYTGPYTVRIRVRMWTELSEPPDDPFEPDGGRFRPWRGSNGSIQDLLSGRSEDPLDPPPGPYPRRNKAPPDDKRVRYGPYIRIRIYGSET